MNVYVLSFIITTEFLCTHLSSNDMKLVEHQVHSGVTQLPHRDVGDILLHRQATFSLPRNDFGIISPEIYKLR